MLLEEVLQLGKQVVVKWRGQGVANVVHVAVLHGGVHESDCQRHSGKPPPPPLKSNVRKQGASGRVELGQAQQLGEAVAQQGPALLEHHLLWSQHPRCRLSQAKQKCAHVDGAVCHSLAIPNADAGQAALQDGTC